MQDLTGTEGDATDINNAGDIVGWMKKPDGTRAAFLYSDGTLYDLNDFVSPEMRTLGTAYEINDRGQIVVGGGYNSGFYMDSYLLTPVPEPTSLFLLASGGIALLRRQRKRK
jgi:probable HAF family extracellular repeat protein